MRIKVNLSFTGEWSTIESADRFASGLVQGIQQGYTATLTEMPFVGTVQKLLQSVEVIELKDSHR